MTTIEPGVVERLVESIQRDDAYLVPYLLDWCGMGDPQPWGAATGFALEVAAGYGLIEGESDGTPTELGIKVTAALAVKDQP